MTSAFGPAATSAATPTAHTPCPKCGSEDARYLNVIHEAGLSSVNTTTKGAGCSPLTIILFPFIGFWSLLFSSFGSGKTSGTVQTVASIKAAPPERKPMAFSALLLLAGLFLLSSHSFMGLVLLVFGGLSAYTAWTFNHRVLPYQRQVWEQSAMCQRCGTIYVPDQAGITLEATSTRQIMEEQQRKLVVAAQPMLTKAQDLSGQVVQKAAQKATQKADEIRMAAQRETQSQAAQNHDDQPRYSPDERNGEQS